MTPEISPPVAIVQKGVRRVRLSDCLTEVNKGVGPSWKNYRVLGATRDGLAAAKEPVGKQPERYKLVEPGTIFYNPMRILIGSIAFVDEGQEPGITSPDYVVFRSQQGIVHPRWLYYWLRSDQGAAFIKTLARGAVRERMLFRRLAAAETFIPPYDAQIEFANQVLAVQRARSAAEAQLEAATALRIVHLRTVFNTLEAQRWQKKRLGEVCEITMGQSPEGASYNSEGIGEPLLNGPTEFGPLSPRPVQWTTLPTRFAETGDILLCVRGATTGRKNVADRRYCIGRGLASIRGRPELASTDFLWFALDLVTARILGQSSGSTFPNLTGEKLEQIEIPIPAFRIQQLVSTKLKNQTETIERARKALEQQLDTINTLPAALLCRAFNGDL